jgi:two-component system, NarL family, nitrate/nitrite response regulator NarL
MFALAVIAPRGFERHATRMALRCLLVDDDARFVESARALLELQGIEVDTASTGAQAVRRASELRPDVVLLDLHLGSDSGFEVARDLQSVWSSAASSHDGPRIILISTSDQSDFQRLIDASPVLGFIAKSSLSARAVRELLDGGSRG